MAAEERDRESPGQEGFVTDILKEATTSGTGDDPPPPAEPQAAAMPRRGDGDGDIDRDIDRDIDGDTDVVGAGDADDNRNTE
jgi:hypothetical protein